jgi:4-amino-4-deoxy-L-arabinose transferase-like glycosyltransferase
MNILKRRWDPLASILLLAALLRLALPLAAWLTTRDPAAFTTADSSTYLEPARSLLSQGAFAVGGQPDIVRTPGYPLFLAIGMALGHAWLVTIALQILLSCLSVYLTYKIAESIFSNPRVSLAASLLYAMEPLSVLYTSKLMTESLFTTLVLAAVFMVSRYLRDGRSLHLLMAALAVSVAAYTRPVGYYLFIVLAAVVTCRPPLRPAAVLRGLALAGLCLALLLPWSLRNQNRANYPGFSAISDVNLYFFHLPAVLAHRQGCTYLQLKLSRGMIDLESFFQHHPQARTWDQGQIYRYLHQQALQGILSDIPYFLYLHLKGMVLILVGPGTGEFLSLFRAGGLAPPDLAYSLGLTAPAGQVLGTLFKHLPYLGLSLLLSTFPVILMILAFAYRRNWKHNRLQIFLLLATAFYFLFLSGGMTANSRFRHPIMPLLCVLAGPGLAALFRSEDKPAVWTSARPAGED